VVMIGTGKGVATPWPGGVGGSGLGYCSEEAEPALGRASGEDDVGMEGADNEAADAAGGIDESLLRINFPCRVFGGGGFFFSPEPVCTEMALTGSPWTCGTIPGFARGSPRRLDVVDCLDREAGSSRSVLASGPGMLPASPVKSNRLNASTSMVARFILEQSVGSEADTAGAALLETVRRCDGRSPAAAVIDPSSRAVESHCTSS
jgi:hypothetical protein